MGEELATAAAPPDLGRDTVRLLQRLIRFDTVNPPGNERALQQVLLEMLEGAGFECELLAAEPERPNLVARLAGGSGGPTLAYLGHVDTVRADPEEWSRDPWGGDLHDEQVWGRGALDMKGQVAAEVSAAIDLARSGWRPPRGELKLVITADEETGGELGASWLCEQHPEAVRADFVLNEGGGRAYVRDGRRLYALSVGEKGIFRFRLRTRGRAGHASLPRIGENALLKLAPLVARLERQPPPQPTPEGLEFLSAAFGERIEPQGLEDALGRLRQEEPLIADFLAEPMMSVTLTPTKARASEKANVIPSVAEVLVDCRVPPGQGEREVREQVAALLGDGDYEIEFSEVVAGNRSPTESELSEAIGGWLAEEDPGATLLPMVMPGFSDSNWFREAFEGVTVYGFCPHRHMPPLESAALIHAADERVPVADVELATRFFHALPGRLLS